MRRLLDALFARSYDSLRLWVHGLVAAGISGAASAVAVATVTSDMRAIRKAAIVSAVITVAAYLKRSPLPESKEKL